MSKFIFDNCLAENSTKSKNLPPWIGPIHIDLRSIFLRVISQDCNVLDTLSLAVSQLSAKLVGLSNILQKSESIFS